MEVISSQCSSSARSNSRSRKKGLSLTSQRKLDSYEKQSLTEDTLQTMAHIAVPSQTSIKFENFQERKSWVNGNYKEIHQLALIPKSLSETPKITFRYTNEAGNDFYKVNLFTQQSKAGSNVLPSRGRPMNCQQMRKVIISSSVQTKNMSQSKINTQSFIHEANPSKQLIDSRKIDREIIEERVIAYLPSIVKTDEAKISLICQSPQKHNIPISHPNDSINKKIDAQNEYKPFAIDQNSSPYQRLASSTKKNESRQLSSGKRQYGSLQMMSLQKIPQVQQFNMNLTEDQTSFSDNNLSQRDENQRLTVTSNQKTNFADQIQIRVSEPLTAKQINHEIISSEQKVMGNKQINVIEIPDTQQKNKQLSNSNSSCKKQWQKKENALRQFENKAPESQQGGSMSGKRNIKRIRQIQKRLQQIINICSSNL